MSRSQAFPMVDLAGLPSAPSGTRERRLAAAFAGLLAVTFAIVAPLAHLELDASPQFVAAYDAAIMFNDLITAVLLLSQARLPHCGAAAPVGLAYLFTSLMAVPHLLVFPGLFVPPQLIGDGAQSTAWIWLFWHAGFPTFVLAFAWRSEAHAPGASGGRLLAGVLAVIAGAGALTALALGGGLPVLITPEGRTPLQFSLAWSVWALNLAALVTLWVRGRRSVLDVWLMVVMCAWVFEIALSASFPLAHHAVGAYASRAYGLGAATFVLAALLVEATMLQQRLALALGEVRDSGEALARSQERLETAQRLEAVGRLAGGVAHDFNNLLQVVSGGLGLLERSEDPARRRMVFEGMRQAVDNGAALTGQLLGFARGRPLDPQPIDLRERIEGLRVLLHRTLRGDIEVVTDLPAGLWPALADAAELELALLNLCVNARDAMPDGGTVVIRGRNLRAVRLDRIQGDFIRLSVADTGTGMTAEVRARAFEPFFTTKVVGRGSGLGLPQVYAFARQSGGSAEVESAPGVGTTVSLLLPRSAVPPVQAVPAPQAPVQGAATGSVLLVEDDTQVAGLVDAMLGQLGYRVARAADAQGALETLAGDAPIDVVVSDVLMPGSMNGVDLAHEILRRHPAVPVLLSSGQPGGESVSPLPPRVELLAKPFTLGELDAAVRRARAAVSLAASPSPPQGWAGNSSFETS